MSRVTTMDVKSEAMMPMISAVAKPRTGPGPVKASTKPAISVVTWASKSARAAVDAGYDRAFWTIFDAHVTTLIAGFVLAFTGTGPVRGFATALIIGIIASLFTSIVVTRLITTYIVHGRNASTVSV